MRHDKGEAASRVFLSQCAMALYSASVTLPPKKTARGILKPMMRGSACVPRPEAGRGRLASE
jgi:hypothetical protein